MKNNASNVTRQPGFTCDNTPNPDVIKTFLENNPEIGEGTIGDYAIATGTIHMEVEGQIKKCWRIAVPICDMEGNILNYQLHHPKSPLSVAGKVVYADPNERRFGIIASETVWQELQKETCRIHTLFVVENFSDVIALNSIVPDENKDEIAVVAIDGVRGIKCDSFEFDEPGGKYEPTVLDQLQNRLESMDILVPRIQRDKKEQDGYDLSLALQDYTAALFRD